MRLSQEVMENLDGIRFFRGKFDSGSSDQIFHIAISEMHLKKDTTLSVENTLNGSMEDTIKETGTVSRNYTASDTEISGLPAKQAVYVNKLDGLPFYIHGLVVRSTQRAWKIMIITTIRSAPAISKRVIESLKIRIKKEYSKL